MVFTWNWRNTCVVFKWWRVSTVAGFIFSLLAIVAISASYEFLKYWGNKWEQSYVNTMSGAAANTSAALVRRFKTKKALFYGLQVGYSFMLMLVFMTYSGWFMLAVVVGAVLGNYVWGLTSDIAASRPMACH
ncbi:uncharacterized protein PRCAT00000718001 [Priceomyces carsonii]|uniref:uncharacterized protein n=1 Tax=Priceomyces carsonii TaxID=28549 RepID=UPI002ED7EAC7|nr:unnamed protein product [Priceomyces carsonii]